MAADLEKDPKQVAEMFDSIAGKYDFTNDVISLGQDRLWRRATVKALDVSDGDLVLDLAAGTGTSSDAIAKKGAEVIACDFSVGMLEVGKQQYPHLTFVAGDATALPFPDNTFEAVTISFGLRNVVDTEKALSEMFRVTKPGGKIVICEFSEPTWKPFRTLYNNYLSKALPKVAGFVTRDPGAYDYLADSISAWPNQKALGKLMLAAGWQQVGYRNLSGGIVALHRATKPAN